MGIFYARIGCQATENQGFRTAWGGKAASIRGQLQGFRKYCGEVSAQCGGIAVDLNADREMIFASGRNAGFLRRADAVKKYLEKLEEWEKNEEEWFLYQQIAEVLDRMLELVDLYYSDFLKPLAETLNSLPPVLEENERYIRVQSETGPDDFLIDPLTFVQTYQAEFSEAAASAERNFLTFMARNMDKLIGKTLLGVGWQASRETDVPSFLSNLLADSCGKLLSVSMDQIMESNLKPGAMLNQYISDRMRDLIRDSSVMFRKADSVRIPSESFGFISVSGDSPKLLEGVREFLKKQDLRADLLSGRAVKRAGWL